MKFCILWRFLFKKKGGIFWKLYQDFYLVQKNKKKGTSAIAYTDNFLSFVHIKEHRCFLLKTHWSDYNWKLNAKAANLFHGIWLQECKHHQLCGTVHVFPWLEGVFTLSSSCKQTNQSQTNHGQTRCHCYEAKGLDTQEPNPVAESTRGLLLK